jgi:hypothetical protein
MPDHCRTASRLPMDSEYNGRSRNGIVGNHETELKPNVQSLLPTLIQQGYDVVFRGKVAHGKAKHHSGYIPPDVTMLPKSRPSAP